MVQERTILPADCQRIFATDSVDEAMAHLMKAVTGDLGFVWQPVQQPRWYFGEAEMQKPGPRPGEGPKPPG
jgi:hypothetical protein